MATNQERARETESAILKAALKLGLAQGVDCISVRDVCREAGVSIGSFYHHFSSRQELIHRAFQMFDDTLRDSLPAHAAHPPLEALTEILLRQTEFVMTEGGFAVTDYYKAILNDPGHSAVSPNRAYYKAVVACVGRAAAANLFTVKLSDPEIAELCIQFVRGCIVDWCLHGQSYDVLEHVRTSLAVLLRGLTA
ncbi:MAG: TetR/AcrR family transcriptional regulator [Ruthenibacterium sp.]